jgi:UDP-glucuronate 4-epimerase
MCAYLLERSDTVIATYRSSLPVGLKRMSEQYPGKLHLVQGDLLEDELYRKLEDYPIDSVVHAAVVTSIDTSPLEALVFMVNTNISSTNKLIDYCIRKKIKNFVYVSSAGVYGAAHPQGTIVPENGLLDLYSTYAITKRTCEQVTAKFGELAEAKAISARVGAPYGPYERITNSRVTMSPLYRMIKIAVKGGEARLYNPKVARDWTYVDDTVAGLYLLLTTERKQLRHTEYNLAAGIDYSLEELARAVAKVSQGFRYQFVDNPQDADIMIIPDFGRGRLDMERLRVDTGFTPAYDLISGVRKYYGHELLYGEEEA